MDPFREAPSAPAPGFPVHRRRGVIDVGTNSVKLLIGAIHGRQVVPLLERSRQTRLGEGLFATRRLAPDAIALTVDAVREYAELARSFGLDSLAAIATAAAREAENPQDLRDAVRAASGLELEVIDGRTEADWAFEGIGTGPEGHAGPTLVTDLGGGSTEFVLGCDGHCLHARSHPLGANRLFAQLAPGDRPGPGALHRCRTEIDRFLQNSVVPELQQVRREQGWPSLLYRAVGGSVVILARMLLGMDGFDRDRIEARVLTHTEIRDLTERLWDLDLEGRRKLVGLPPERADIILTGAAVHEGILRNLQLDSLRPSTRGLRFAALLHRS